MLGRVGLRARERLVERRDQLHCDVRRDRQRAPRRTSRARRVREEQRLAVLSVLGLGEQIRRDGGRRGRGIRDHDDLARPGRQVDAHTTRDQKLGRGDVGVPRPHDGVDRRHRPGAVGERRHGLRPTDRVNLVDPELSSDDERCVRRVRGHDRDPADAGHEGRHRGHHERRRKRQAPAGNADADRAERQPAALGDDARRRLDRGVGRSLRLAEPADGVDHPPERVEDVVVDPRSVDALGGHPDPVRSRPVEPRGPLEQRLVPALAHVGDDRRDRRERLVERPPHATSRSIGRTRIDVAPARRSTGSRFQISSTSTAACTAISPSSASCSTDGAPIPGRTARIAGRSSTCGVHHHVAAPTTRHDAGEHQLELLDSLATRLDRRPPADENRLRGEERADRPKTVGAHRRPRRDQVDDRVRETEPGGRLDRSGDRDELALDTPLGERGAGWTPGTRSRHGGRRGHRSPSARSRPARRRRASIERSRARPASRAPRLPPPPGSRR